MSVFLYGLRNNIPNSKEFGELFYVGVGSVFRMQSHWKRGRKSAHYNYLMQTEFDKHLAAGVKPIEKVLVELDSHESAFELETRCVDAYGRKVNGTGCLCNLARGGAGPDSELMQNPIIVKKIGDSTRKKFTDSAYRSKFSKVMQEVASTNEFKDKVSEGVKKSFENQETRGKHLGALKAINSELSFSDRSTAAKLGYELNPERRKQVSEWSKANNAKPEVIASKSKKSTEANLKSWQDPEIRARRIAGMQGKRHKRLSVDSSI